MPRTPVDHVYGHRGHASFQGGTGSQLGGRHHKLKETNSLDTDLSLGRLPCRDRRFEHATLKSHKAGVATPYSGFDVPHNRVDRT